MYTCAINDPCKAYTVTNGLLSTSPTDSGTGNIYFPGATPTISANGISNAILWVLDSHWYGTAGPVALVFCSPTMRQASLRAPYTTHCRTAGRDNPGGAIKFSVPTVANGKVYVGAEGQLSVYGQLTGGD